MSNKTLHMAWEYIEPMLNLNTGAVIREGFWKCTKLTNRGRESVAAWVQMPLTDGGYVRKSAVVEVTASRAIMLQDETFPDEAFPWSVLRHDVSGREEAA